jgi:hypothetical protein
MVKADAACITWHRAVEEFRGAQDDGEDRRDEAAGLRDDRGAHVLDADVAPRAQHRPERAVDAGALLLLALDEGDALAVLAQAGEHVAIGRLGLVLLLRDRDEAAPDDHHGAARQERIEHGGDDQKPRNDEGGAADVDRKRSADRPQHDDESRGGENRRGHAGDEIDRRLGRHPHVVGDAVFGVLVVAAHQVELIIAAAGEPTVDQTIVEPRAPAPLHGHARIDLHDAEEHARGQQRDVDHRQEQGRAGIVLFQRVEEPAVPQVHSVGGGEVEQDDDEQRAGQDPRYARPLPAPETGGAGPEPPQQIAPFALARVLVRLLVRFLVGLLQIGDFFVGLLRFPLVARSVGVCFHTHGLSRSLWPDRR